MSKQYALRESLCAVAALARGLSIWLHRRQWNAPSAELLRDRLMAAIFSAWRTRFAERLVLADNTLLPLILVPGHSPSREQKCLTLAKWLKLGPSWLSIFIITVTPNSLMRVRSTLAQLAGFWRVSQRLQACVRQSDTVARLGGDKFVLLLGQLGDSEDGALVLP